MNLAHRIELWPIDRLTPYARNARTHSPDQVAKIAASITEFGFNNPILVDSEAGIIAGHGRMAAARMLGLAEVPVIVLDHLSDAQRRAYVLADNKLAELAGWDVDMLSAELQELADEGFDLEVAGFSEDELAALAGDADVLHHVEAHERRAPGSNIDPEKADETPPVPVTVVTRPGDVWVLGGHRVMCGDSTNAHDVATLMAGQKATLLHADPPYGMGKEADGVANDNLRGQKLDGFQMDWWGAFRPHLTPNASAYIWGNAPDLWRLWYLGGLADSEQLEIRNEVVWKKNTGQGQLDPGTRMFPVITERCLFFQIGEQFLGAVNADAFPEEWAPVLAYFEGEAKAAGITAPDVLRVCGVGMFSHWFTRSQFTLVPERHYLALRAAYPGHFERPWSDVKAEWDAVKRGPKSALDSRRSYFDNTHEAMTEVWEFPLVTGNERHGHATPKPVAMMERAIKSSSRPGDLVVEPFGGSGSTLIACESTGRACRTMELQANYCDVIVLRWQKLTGGAAVLEATGQTFQEAANERRAANDNQADAAAA